MDESDQFTYSTKLWQRSPNSFASTIPQPILAIKGVPVDSENDVNVEWGINPDTGNVEVSFSEVEGDE